MSTERQTLTAVSDSAGFVGAWATPEAARAAVAEFEGEFLFAQYRRHDPESTRVWVVPYREIDAVAIVTDNRAVAEATHASLLRVDLTYPDDIDFWEHAFGVVAGPARRRIAERAAPADAELINAEALVFGTI
jgi:hypothetical protein